MQGTWVQSLSREDSNRHGATKPAPTKPGRAAAEARLLRACAPRREEPTHLHKEHPARRQPEKPAGGTGDPGQPEITTRNTTALTPFSQESTIKQIQTEGRSTNNRLGFFRNLDDKPKTQMAGGLL